MLVRNAEVEGAIVDVRVSPAGISAIEDALAPLAGETTIDAEGGALLPGLHDHHIHLFSLAASLRSVICGPPEIQTRDELARSIARAVSNAPDPAQWIRGSAYFESVAGDLDRALLDVLCPRNPIRIQHRSGSMWFLNTAALEQLGLAGPGSSNAMPDGVEVDTAGRATGRLFRLDAWMRERLPASNPPGLAEVGMRLAACGVTGVTDATPDNGEAEFALFRDAQQSGALPQRVHLMGGASVHTLSATRDLSIGPFKILFDEADLPPLDEMADTIRAAHSTGRAVAIHTVTRGEIFFALAALDAAGTCPGDRLEHASLAPTEAVERARRGGLTIVTQPNFVFERGDAYLRDVAARDRPDLYRLRSWLQAHVPLAGGTDAPFGSLDPWLAMRAAVDRRTAGGAELRREEAVSAERALALFTTEASDPGGAVRRVAVGRASDLCLLHVPWSRMRADLDARHVRATIRTGHVIWDAEAGAAARA